MGAARVVKSLTKQQMNSSQYSPDSTCLPSLPPSRHASLPKGDGNSHLRMTMEWSDVEIVCLGLSTRLPFKHLSAIRGTIHYTGNVL